MGIDSYCFFSTGDPNFISNVSVKPSSLTFFYPGSSNYQSTYYNVTCYPGTYIFESWGASGHGNGYGAYTKGMINFHQTSTFYVFLGGRGQFKDTYGTYNGGGAGDQSGGGASDFRLIPGLWNNTKSLLSRIMVAAGGGGQDSGNAGPGGALVGLDAVDTYYNLGGFGASQTEGGIGYYRGSFGFGGGNVLYNSNGTRIDNGGGGGGGYYGGGSGKGSNCCAAGGGSSYISGHPGCSAVLFNETITHVTHPFHYSQLTFIDTSMITGADIMPNPFGQYETGHNNNGSARITLINCQAVYYQTIAHTLLSLRIHNIILLFNIIFFLSY